MSKTSNNRNKIKLNHGLITVFRDLFQSIFSLVILFLSAGTFNWWNGRIYLIIIILHHVAKTILLHVFNPTLFKIRANIFTEDTKKYDRIFVFCFIVLSLLLYIIAGIGVRFKWTSFDRFIVYVGIPIFVIGWIIGIWAMIVNRNFTMTISVDNKHYVCTKGPYKIIRHPGYAAEILMIIVFPLILGTIWAYIPAILLFLVFIVRTYFEDKVLKKELEGYNEYSQRTKFRLFPFIW